MKSLQLWQNVGLVRVTFRKLCPVEGLWSRGRSEGDPPCPRFFTTTGLRAVSAMSAPLLLTQLP